MYFYTRDGDKNRTNHKAILTYLLMIRSHYLTSERVLWLTITRRSQKCGVTFGIKRKNLSVFVLLSLWKIISDNTKSLPPLNYGDHVVILKQTGNFPSKWAKSGVVVEVKDCHQCVVKVNESGRLTVQNRKFLRRFTPPVCKSLSNIPYLRKANIPL